MHEKHILGRFDSIVNDLPNANIKDIVELMKYYNGEPV